MSDEDKNKEGKTGKEDQDFTDKLIEKGKDFADKAENFVAEKLSNARSSDSFGKISGLFDKVENFMETKADEFHSGEMEAKIEAFRSKAEVQADELLKKAREAGLKIGDQVDQTLDALKRKKDKPGNQNGGGI